LGLEKTAGVVEPNFLGFTGTGGITLDRLASIRALADVELAAPVAFIGYITTQATTPTIYITKWPSSPTLYQADLTVATSDGLGQRLLYRQHVRVLLEPPTKPGGPPLAVSDYGDVGIGTYPDGSYGIDISGDRLLPNIVSPVLAVDPVAERQLLGSAGAGLSPLVDLAGQEFTARHSTSRASRVHSLWWGCVSSRSPVDPRPRTGRCSRSSYPTESAAH
jgi:hypothetical protein